MKMRYIYWGLLAMVGLCVNASGDFSGLAPWVGENVLLGEDPAALPSGNGKNQAEPHAIRSVTDPDLILATFQDGRRPDGGAYGNGFAVSEDGGFTWRRGLNPDLTLVDGGEYFRATDPVGGISREGTLYLNSLVALDNFFELGRLVIQRSDDRGHTWTSPRTIYTGLNPDTGTTIFPDKNWMVVNDYEGSPTSGRILVTWTNFRTIFRSGQAVTDFLIRSSYSDDRGDSWSAPIYITPPPGTSVEVLQFQGSQPVFLPGGGVAVVYHNFLTDRLEVSYSPDGGTSFPFPRLPVHNGYTLYDTPNMRDGSFLPAVDVARETGDIYIAYTSKDSPSESRGHIYFVRSDLANPGVSPSIQPDWRFRTPVKISGDEPTRIVSTSTLSVTPDGQRVTVYFYDNRNGTGVNDSGDFYAVQSIDSGLTWSTPFRLTGETFELNKATNTSRGYMIGDYFGFAAPLGPDQAGVAVWVDTRGETADPWSARIGGLEGSVFDSWLQTNLSYADRDLDEPSMRFTDLDRDGIPHILEYVLGQSPRVKNEDPDFSDSLSFLTLAPSTDLETQVTVQGGSGRWPLSGKQLISATPQELPHGEGYWNELTWPQGGQFDYLEFTFSSGENWYLLHQSAPVRWLLEIGDDWGWSPWFGSINSRLNSWLFHTSLGWVYDLQGLLYHPGSSAYLFPDIDSYPWIYKHDGSYLYVLEDQPWVYETSSGNWIRTY